MKHLDNGANIVFAAVVIAVLLYLCVTVAFHLPPPSYTS